MLLIDMFLIKKNVYNGKLSRAQRNQLFDGKSNIVLGRQGYLQDTRIRRVERNVALCHFLQVSQILRGVMAPAEKGGQVQRFSDKIRNLYLYQHQKSKNFPTKH